MRIFFLLSFSTAAKRKICGIATRTAYARVATTRDPDIKDGGATYRSLEVPGGLGESHPWPPSAPRRGTAGEIEVAVAAMPYPPDRGDLR